MVALRIWIGITIALSVVAMKWASLRVAPLHGEELRSFIWSPALAVSSWRKRRPFASTWLRKSLIELVLLSIAVVTSWYLYLNLVPGFRPSTWEQGYIGAVPLYLLVHLLSLFVGLAFAASGWIFPAHMRWPFLASSIDEFWGRRWATWVSDWCRQVIFGRYRRQPLFGAFVVFVASGVWHEVLIDVPLLAIYGINVVGGWLLYFAIQAVGAALERLVFNRPSPFSRLYAWAVIVLPAPLALNEATLRAIGLYV